VVCLTYRHSLPYTISDYVLKTYANFFLADNKVQSDKGGGKILLGKNTGGGAGMLWAIRFQRV
jgi:hypothetical protein